MARSSGVCLTEEAEGSTHSLLHYTHAHTHTHTHTQQDLHIGELSNTTNHINFASTFHDLHGNSPPPHNVHTSLGLPVGGGVTQTWVGVVGQQESDKALFIPDDC